MHDQAAQARAPLAGGADGGEKNATHDEVEVGARRDDRGVVATELEQRAPEPGRDAWCELLAHLRRAGGRHEGHTRVVGELHGAVGATDHELGEAVGRAAEALGGPLEERHARNRGERRPL